jgi:transposase-like protein
MGEVPVWKALTFYRLPQEHHKHLKTTNMLERLNQMRRQRRPPPIEREVGVFESSSSGGLLDKIR